MASPIDILLKVGADVRGALQGLDQVEGKARSAEREVAKLESTATRVGRALRTAADRGRYAVGAAAGTFAAGGNLGEVAFAGLGAAFPAAGVAFAAGMAGGQAIDRLQGDAQAIAELEKAIGAPTSVSGLAADLRALAGRRAGQLGSPGRWFRQGGDIFTKSGPFGDETPWNPGATDRARELRKAFRMVVRANPALAAQVLAELGNPEDLARVYAEETAAMKAEQTRAVASQAFLAGLPPSSVTNVYSTFSGLGGEGAVGREVRQVLDRRERNNARYQSTSDRRG